MQYVRKSVNGFWRRCSSERRVRLLLAAKGIFPAVLSCALSRAFWRNFWNAERKKESALFGVSVPELNGSERAVLIEALFEFAPFGSVLEVGSAFGQNFHLLAPLFPEVSFVGVDRDSECVAGAKSLFSELRISNVEFLEQDMEKLHFPDQSFDLVFSSAALLFISPEKISAVISEMWRVSRKGIVLLEQHQAGAPDQSFIRGDGARYWVRDYEELAKGFAARERVTVKKVLNALWTNEQWDKFGSVIRISR